MPDGEILPFVAGTFSTFSGSVVFSTFGIRGMGVVVVVVCRVGRELAEIDGVKGDVDDVVLMWLSTLSVCDFSTRGRFWIVSPSGTN